MWGQLTEIGKLENGNLALYVCNLSDWHTTVCPDIASQYIHTCI